MPKDYSWICSSKIIIVTHWICSSKIIIITWFEAQEFLISLNTSIMLTLYLKRYLENLLN